MASLLGQLPAPSKQYTGPVAPAAPAPAPMPQQKEVPPYLRRQNFVPRRPEDFGGGGAFPELPFAQFPLDMGRPDAARGSKTLAVSVNTGGEVAYDALLKQGSHKEKVIAADHMALVPKVDRMSKEVSDTLFCAKPSPCMRVVPCTLTAQLLALVRFMASSWVLLAPRLHACQTCTTA